MNPEEAAAQAAFEAAVKQAERERQQEAETVMAVVKQAHIGSTALGQEFAAEQEAERRKAQDEAEELAAIKKATKEAEEETAYLRRRMRDLERRS